MQVVQSECIKTATGLRQWKLVIGCTEVTKVLGTEIHLNLTLNLRTLTLVKLTLVNAYLVNTNLPTLVNANLLKY